FVFGTIVRAAFVHAWFAMLPYAVKHRRPTPSPSLVPIEPSVRPQLFGHIILLVNAVRSRLPSADPWTSLRHLGRGLEWAALRPTADFAHDLRSLLHSDGMGRLQLLEDLLARSQSKPEYWLNTIRSNIDELWNALRTEPFLIPPDLNHRGTDALA